MNSSILSSFLFSLFAFALRGVNAEEQCERSTIDIYTGRGWSPDFITGAKGTVVDETDIVLRDGSSKTLMALTEPFTEFSFVTTLEAGFPVDSIVDIVLQGSAIQSTAVYMVDSRTGTVSEAVHLNDISPEAIAVSEVIQDRFRIVGPDAGDWFRLSINAKDIRTDSSDNQSWDTIIFRDVSGVGASLYIAEARILPDTQGCLKDITPISGCIGSVCNPDIDGVMALSKSVPLYGFGPLSTLAAETATAAGIVDDISIIAKLKPGTTNADVAKLCATLQGMDPDTAPADVFARGWEIDSTLRGSTVLRDDLPKAACKVDMVHSDGPEDEDVYLYAMSAEAAAAEVEWPLVTITVSSYDAINDVRDLATDYVSYFDRDGIAFASGRPLGGSGRELRDGGAEGEGVVVVHEVAEDASPEDAPLEPVSSDVEQTDVEQADVINSAAKPAGCPGIPWGLSRIDQANLPLDGVYNTASVSGARVHVYILDTGLNNHSDFAGRLGDGVDCTSGTCRSSSYADGTGHGTHVAATVAGTCYGVAKGAIIHPVKVLSNGSGSYSGIIAGIRWATDHAKRNGVRGVINMSLGGSSSGSLNSATNTAVAQGMVVAVAAGNESGADACSKSPASASEALTTGAITKTDRWASFSNVGRCLDIWAPGSRVASANYQNFNGYTFKDGTSMASPHVAGAAALYLQKYPNATPAQVRDGLLKAAVQRNIYSGSTTAILQVIGL